MPFATFAKLLPISHVLLDLDVSSKKRLFEQIGLLFENENKISRAAVFDALFAREKLGSTGLGHGVAIPHGRIKSLRDTLAVFIRTKDGVPFESPDGEAVRLVFAILVPEHATEQHLNLLSELAQVFSDATLRQALLDEPDQSRAHDMLIYGSTLGSSDAAAQRTAAV
ncbi:MAG: PTS sugar transporter subunit IIA [Betaproteobacteria bacterium]|jgi:PTS system nitrogen regulatory IIA component|nr:PTS sugar transporter subunit IIA [Betaproteobacteria bacterium UKL13-2]HCG53052.1 PTS sugar transporter subunit IIA [Betaproteobacteria bacterium]